MVNYGILVLAFVYLSFLKFSRFDDSISLKRLGISDVALATLASEGEGTSRMC